jgi:predicted nucleic acid-binding protein
VTPASGALRLVVDSSVAVKWFLPGQEPDTADALALLEQHASGDVLLAAPDLLLLEVSNALKKRGVPERRQRDVVTALSKSNMEFERLTTLHADAVSLSVEHGLTVYDATFAALAKQLGAQLVTADKKLAGCAACETRLLGRGLKR